MRVIEPATFFSIGAELGQWRSRSPLGSRPSCYRPRLTLIPRVLEEPLRRILVVSLVLVAAFELTAQPANMPLPMSKYSFGLLRRGPTWTAERTPRTDSIQAGHMANIRRMHEAGLLVAAGPFENGGDWRGIFIFRGDSTERVLAMVAGDPAVASGRLVLDLYPWFAPAGIGDLYRARSQKPDHRDSMVTREFAMITRGPQWKRDPSPEVQANQRSHVEGIFRMLLAGELATAGPFTAAGPDTNFAGVFVFRGDSTAARALAAKDPAVQSGRLSLVWQRWWVAWGSFPGDTL
jgi:uncharacterized protein YciI